MKAFPEDNIGADALVGFLTEKGNIVLKGSGNSGIVFCDVESARKAATMLLMLADGLEKNDTPST